MSKINESRKIIKPNIQWWKKRLSYARGRSVNIFLK